MWERTVPIQFRLLVLMSDVTYWKVLIKGTVQRPKGMLGSTVLNRFEFLLFFSLGVIISYSGEM